MRSRRLSTGLMIAMVVGATMATARLATAAKKRIVVLEIRGTLSEDLQAVMIKLLDKDHRVISSVEYDKAASQLRAGTITDRNVARVAKKLAAEGILHGWITTTRDDQLLLRLRLRNGATGKVVKKIAVLVKSEKLSRGVRSELKKRLLAAIDELEYVEVDTRVEPATKTRSKGRVETSTKASKTSNAKTKTNPSTKTRTRTKAKKTKPEPEPFFDDDENPLAPKGGKKSHQTSAPKPRLAKVDEDDIEIDDEDADDLDTSGDEEDDDPEGADDEVAREPRRRPGPATGSLVAAAVDVGLSVMSRTLAFDSRTDLANAPAGYHGPMVPALHLGAEIYPGLLDDRDGILTRFGAGVAIDRVFGLETAIDGQSGALPTTQMRYGVDVRYRHRLGKPTVTVSLGLSRLEFAVDKQAAPSGVTIDVPNTAYTYLDPGVEVAMPVANKITVAAHAKVLLVQDAGEVQTVEQYGAGKVTGLDLEVGGSYTVSSQLTVAASLSYLGFAFDFHGNGELANNRDGDPNTIDVGGASDRYLAGYLTATYAL